MPRQAWMLRAVKLPVALSCLALVAAGDGSVAAARFAVASIRLEQNATDKDAEIVIEAVGGRDGLTRLTVFSPEGRTVLDVSASDGSKLGLREFRLESPEPKDVERLKSGYPEGVYRFTGTTAAGANLAGQARLSHRLPDAAAFLRPRADARDVPAGQLEIAWTPVRNLAGHIVYIEQPELNVEITARLPGSAVAFTVPDGFLVPGKEYQMGLGTVSTEGNVSFVETTVTTAGKR